MSDSSDLEDEEEEDKSLSKNDLREMLRLHKFGRQCKNQVYIESEVSLKENSPDVAKCNVV